MADEMQADAMGLSPIEHAAWNLFFNMEEVGGPAKHELGRWFEQEYAILGKALMEHGLNIDPNSVDRE